MSLTSEVCTRCGENGLYCTCEQFHPNTVAYSLVEQAVIQEILAELKRAELIHTNYPTDPVRRTALIVEEVGEAMREALDYTRPNRNVVVAYDRLREELVHTAALCLKQLTMMRQEEI